MPELKVYRWNHFRREAGRHLQTYEIMAAHSVAEVLRVSGLSRTEWKQNGGTSGNTEEFAQAMSEPGVIFWCETGASHRPGAKNWRAVRPAADEPGQYDCIDIDGTNRGEDHDYGSGQDRECSRCGAEPPTE